jgi:hypothetical protein
MKAIISLFFCLAVLASTGLTSASMQEEPSATTHTARPPLCICCDQPIEVEHNLITYRGRTIYVHQGDCTAHWNEHRDHLFRQLKPTGALFDEDGVVTGLKTGWLLLGIYVVAGLISGACCAYLALAKGHEIGPWFLLGLLFNIPALLTALFMSKRDATSAPHGVPGGLRKVPMTSTPVPCPGCGVQLHPSARTCSSCGQAREPIAQSETERI